VHERRSSRRDFLRQGARAAALAFATRASRLMARLPPPEVNLVPGRPGKTPSYWCTWGIQNYSLEAPDELTHATVANNLTEKLMFQDPGWATNYFAKARGDLYILYDLGWDVPPGLQFDKERWRLGSLEVSTAKFPSCSGTPAQRLRELNIMTKAAGWRGAAIWIPAQALGDGKDGKLMGPKELEQFFRERLRWSHEAGIEYWKVDYGARGGDADFRKLITTLAQEEAPGMLVEHARGCGPVSDEEVPWEKLVANKQGSYRTWDNGKVLHQALELLEFSDILRTYDVTAYFSVPTTLDRVAQILAGVSKSTGKSALLNCEDEPYIGAALGTAMGILRHPLWRDYPNKPYDPRNLKRRIDEVTRAVRWQRLAPAFGVGKAKVRLDDDFQLDHWVFQENQTWAQWLAGREVVQGAPARVARGMSLPSVHSKGPRPYVVASRNPNGAIAVATLPRISKEQGIHLPLVDVAIEVGDGNSPVGIFGRYQTLTLRLAGSLGRRHVWAQDLAGDRATDITDRVRANGSAVTLSGEVIDSIGRSAATPGDVSDPGLVLQFI
jgi:hypothetical protein